MVGGSGIPDAPKWDIRPIPMLTVSWEDVWYTAKAGGRDISKKQVEEIMEKAIRGMPNELMMDAYWEYMRFVINEVMEMSE